MKKTIALLLAMALVAGGFGGFAYASGEHQKLMGQKLIGTSPFGTHEYSPNEHLMMHASFAFTNPGCLKEIEIRQISIIKGDGTVIYEGPLLQQICVDDEIVESVEVDWPMNPHDIWHVDLMRYMPDPDDPVHEWMNPDEALAQPLAHYTLEIFWSSHGRGGLPLIGTVQTIKRTIEFEEVMESAYGTQMVNLTQPWSSWLP